MSRLWIQFNMNDFRLLWINMGFVEKIVSSFAILLLSWKILLILNLFLWHGFMNYILYLDSNDFVLIHIISNEKRRERR